MSNPSGATISAEVEPDVDRRPAVPPPDLDEAHRFLELLDPEADAFTFQVFDDSPTEDETKARIYHGSLAEHARRLSCAQQNSCGVFVAVNATDGRGRKAGNVTGVRAGFADLDGAPLHPVMSCPLEPHVVVESSPGKFHAYWLCEGLPLESFTGLQKAIATRFGGDNVHDLPRVMRLPGFWHLKAQPFQSRIVHVAESLPYTAERLLAEFPPVAKANGAGGGAGGEAEELAELVRQVLTGEKYHNALRSLAWRYLGAGMAAGQVVKTLRGLMLTAPEADRGDRWQARFNEIPRAVSSAQEKLEGRQQEETAEDVLERMSRRQRAADGGEDPEPEPAAAGGESGVSAWPEPLDEAAFHGLAGEVVRAIEPHSEADPAALLLQFLAAFGNAAGRGPFFRVENDRHAANLFVLLAGRTSKGRKGTSWGQTLGLMELADPDWTRERVASGLSSGEGLIWEVRDPIEKQERIKEKGKPARYEAAIVDPGVEDKRLLVVESEFASTLRVMARDGNTLSAVVRQAWDRGNLRAMTKNSPARATAALISIIGHITADELRRYLDRTELGNAFANRFLLACTRRSKLLPEGGRIDDARLLLLADRIRDALNHARTTAELRRDDEAREVWREVYPALSEGRPGLTGAVVSRAEAQVTRLSLLYALLDQADAIRVPHLTAALAVWDYCEASARHVFGDTTGNPVADEILRALRASPAGLTRSDIVNLFSRHQDGARISRALTELLEIGAAAMARERTGGRPVERWRAAR